LVVAFVMALLPRPPQLPGAPSDKVQHVVAFAVLAALAAWAYPRARPIKVALGLSIFGALIEIAQTIPLLHRDGDPLDWLADTLAAGLVLAIAAWIRRRDSRRI
jgi:hypothetical protein